MLKLNKHFLKEKIINSEGYSSQRRFEVKTESLNKISQSVTKWKVPVAVSSHYLGHSAVFLAKTLITLTLPLPGVY